MKAWVLTLLRCPRCLSCLKETRFQANDQGESWSGVLACCGGDCRSWYPIIRGIPRMVPASLMPETRRQFTHEYDAELTEIGLAETDSAPVGDLHELKQQTIHNFGFEWIEYSRFGWDDRVYSIEREEPIFRKKSLLEPEDIAGRLILDAGCGNGRYSYWAAKYGGRVIGLDLGDGVESAAKNMRDMPNIQVVQGDIFNTPFEDGCFDVIFSIGVLMHTGDAAKATRALAKKLKAGGSLSLHVYGKGNPIYERADCMLRKRTTRMTIGELQEFTRRTYRLYRVLHSVGLANLANRFIRLDPHPHCIFDWYAAPIATHHTYGEVKRWFADLDLKVIRTNEHLGSRSFIRQAWHPLLGSPSTVTVRGTSAK